MDKINRFETYFNVSQEIKDMVFICYENDIELDWCEYEDIIENEEDGFNGISIYSADDEYFIPYYYFDMSISELIKLFDSKNEILIKEIQKKNEMYDSEEYELYLQLKAKFSNL